MDLSKLSDESRKLLGLDVKEEVKE